MKKITRNSKIDEILRINPNSAEILFEAGIYCIGCSMAQFETLEQGLKVHGFNKKQIDDLIKRLNEIPKKAKKRVKKRDY